MPVAAKLSREFYDRFGDKVVDKLVGLLNDMEATFRAELRDLNEENFRRFEAKLEQRVSELGSELRVEIAGLRTDMAAGLTASQARSGTTARAQDGRTTAKAATRQSVAQLTTGAIGDHDPTVR